MRTSTAIVSAPAGPLDALSALVESAREYAAGATAIATRRAYMADWRAFAAWCEGKGLATLPASPATVAVYLAVLADDGRKVATIERALAGIAHAHRTAGQPWQKGAPAVREVLAGIRRRLGVAPVKKAPVTDAELRTMIAMLGVEVAALRDRAIRNRPARAVVTG